MQPLPNGSVTSPQGFTAGAAACGLKPGGALDLALVASDRDCTAGAVFTTNVVLAAPVLLDQQAMQAAAGRMRGVVANSKNANACTGSTGMERARAMQSAAAAQLGCQPEQVLVMSTGVIGVQLDLPKIEAGIASAAATMSASGGLAAAEAIMTTDTHPKSLAVTAELFDGTVTIGGMAKGAGMIAPNMATLLGVVTTDAVLTPAEAQNYLKAAVDVSFNRIVIDGDMSTNDTIILLANGASGIRPDSVEDIAALQVAITRVCTVLAQEIVRDGEGAGKFVTIRVEGTADDAAAAQVANTIARSPLVKTAFAGSDANWGRILMAAGYAGVRFDPDCAALSISSDGRPPLALLDGGLPTGYAEADAAAIFAEDAFAVLLRLGDGSGAATVWTCDLTHDYISINADYRT